MNQHLLLTGLFSVLSLLVYVLLIIRVLLRPVREASSRVAWIVVILALPVLGLVAYILLGETNIGRKRVARMRAVIAGLPDVNHLAGADAAGLHDDVPRDYVHLFQAGKTVNGFDPVEGNRAELMANSNAAIDAIVADIDAAKAHVHLLFYIRLSDNNGLKVVEALKRAAARGVNCRAMADGLGSRSLIASGHWKGMKAAGVHLASALPIGNPLLQKRLSKRSEIGGTHRKSL